MVTLITKEDSVKILLVSDGLQPLSLSQQMQEVLSLALMNLSSKLNSRSPLTLHQDTTH
jgi:hypothetical protein